MDVRFWPAQLPFSSIYNFYAHARAICPLEFGLVLNTFVTTGQYATQFQHGPVKARIRARATAYDQAFLSHKDRTMRRCYRA
jgi:hypothetical protein